MFFRFYASPVHSVTGVNQDVWNICLASVLLKGCPRKMLLQAAQRLGESQKIPLICDWLYQHFYQTSTWLAIFISVISLQPVRDQSLLKALLLIA